MTPIQAGDYVKVNGFPHVSYRVESISNETATLSLHKPEESDPLKVPNVCTRHLKELAIDDHWTFFLGADARKAQT
jgi:hypothetical protein